MEMKRMKITTKDQLENHIKNHKGKNVPLFSAYAEHGVISDDTISAKRKISIQKSRFTGTLFIHLDGVPRYSLRDRHIDYEQDYNDNWWFTSEDEAIAYVEAKK